MLHSSVFFFLPVRQSESKEFQACRLEQEVPVALRQLSNARDPVAEPPDDLQAGRDQAVELLDLGGLVGHQALLRVHQILARSVNVLECGKC